MSIRHVDDDRALCDLVMQFLEREESGIDCAVATDTSPTAALEGDGQFDPEAETELDGDEAQPP
ncbi:hypothetical protein [Natrinema marinum]|uniref:hypothetical protein n=1 Tax=Natrinema marinum TaxID=2961598 RepID=UPI0020C8C6F2|nr:hypothetical protein [Natrinema marinum]